MASSACGGDDESSVDQPSIDQAGAQALWEEIQDADYSSWARAPGWEERLPSVSRHGVDADVFIDPVMAGALAGMGFEEWPEGSISVKDSYQGDEHVAVAAMHKQSGGWFFAEWSAEGTAKYAGLELQHCTLCHVAVNDRAQAFELP